MALDPRIILAGQPFDPNSFSRGLEQSQNAQLGDLRLEQGRQQVGAQREQSERERNFMEARRGLALVDRAQTPEIWDSIAQSVAPELVGQFQKRDVIRAALEATVEAFDPSTPDELKIMKAADGSIVQLVPDGQGSFRVETLAQGKADESALESRARLAGLEPGTPEFQEFMLRGGGGEDREEKRFNVGGRLVDSAGNVIFEPPADAPELPVEGEGKLRAEFNGLTKDFRVVEDSYRRVLASADDPSAAGDLALIFNYMKILDPGSVVRESEFATAQNAAGVPSRIRAQYNNVMRGERLAEEQRGDFLDRANRLYQAGREGFAAKREQYQSIATQYGFDPARAVPDAPAIGSRQPELPADAVEGLKNAEPGSVVQDANGKRWVWDGEKLTPER